MKFYKTLTTLAFLFLAASSFAHTGLDSSIPTDGAMLMESPKTVELDFTADVNLIKFEIVKKMDGTAVEVDFTPSATANSYFSVPMPELAMGHYQVNWSLLGGDGHQIEGSFDFMVHGEGMPMMDHKDVSMPMMDHSGTTAENTDAPAENHESHSGH